MVMSLLEDLAKVAIGVATERGTRPRRTTTTRRTTTSRRSDPGGLGGVMEDILRGGTGSGGSGSGSSSRSGGQGRLPGDLGSVLGGMLGGQSSSAGGASGGLGGLLETLGQASRGALEAGQRQAGSGSRSAGGASGGLGGILGQLAGAAAGAGLGGILGGLLGGGQDAQPAPQPAPQPTPQPQAAPQPAPQPAPIPAPQPGSFGDALNRTLANGGTSPTAPDPAHEALAGVLLLAMIQAAKADGRVDPTEQKRLMDHLGAASPETMQALREALARPIDIPGLAAQVPAGMEPQVYGLSLMAIDLDSPLEAKYMADLAAALRLAPASVAAIHAQMGVRPPG
jgi:uncharacterized membrane protein YebE (DUF533 family)